MWTSSSKRHRARIKTEAQTHGTSTLPGKKGENTLGLFVHICISGLEDSVREKSIDLGPHCRLETLLYCGGV